MSDLYIIYGSESSVLSHFIDTNYDPKIRIYNNTIPTASDNCMDVQLSGFEEILSEQISIKSIKRIIFIGAAFRSQSKLFLNESLSDIEDQLNTNIINYIKLTKLILPYMINLRFGRFIYLSSFRSSVTSRGISIYSSSKAFGEKFFEILGLENAAFGITSHSIRMGYFDGRMIEALGNNFEQSIKPRIGMRRLGRSSDLTQAINFLVECPFTNGGVLELTGGINYA